MGAVLGALFAIIIGMASLPQLIEWQIRAKDSVNAAQVAQEARTFNAAATQYIQSNSATLLATATATTPVTVSVAQLQAANALPAVFRSTNMYGQTWQLEVKQPTVGNLQALATTTGGSALSDTAAMRIVKLIGSDGGFFPKNDTGLYAGGASNAYGPNWGPLSSTGYSAQAGHFASLINLNSGQLTDNRLYRNAIPGQPQLNTMTTPFIMVAIQTPGSACTQIGAIAQEGTGNVVTCQGTGGSGTWKTPGSMFWKDPVNTYSALPTTDPIGAVRITADTNRAFTWTGTTWAPLALDKDGNLNVPGTATINALNGKLQVTATAVEGAGCVGEGRIATSTTTSGLILSCQSSIWRKASGGGSGFAGVLEPLNGKTMSCVIGGIHTVHGKVEGGVFYANAVNLNYYASGWQPGSSMGAVAWMPSGIGRLISTVGISGLNGRLVDIFGDLIETCDAAWPTY